MTGELLFLLVFAILVIVFLINSNLKENSQISELESQLNSKSVLHGQNFEKLIPFSKSFPYNYKNFHFIGNPIDGVVFDSKGITFVEFKTGKSQLSTKQKQIKKFVQDKKIYWDEIRG